LIWFKETAHLLLRQLHLEKRWWCHILPNNHLLRSTGWRGGYGSGWSKNCTDRCFVEPKLLWVKMRDCCDWCARVALVKVICLCCLLSAGESFKWSWRWIWDEGRCVCVWCIVVELSCW
jgi:hypothetical protein